MKYFVISDIHGFFTRTRLTLKKAGFDETNPDHKIILCGDAFDRGSEAIKMFNWLKRMVSKNKLIYIRGNHEDLLENAYKCRYFDYADFVNGTQDTAVQLSRTDGNSASEILKNLASTGIFEFFEDNCINYFETEHYIFVHGYVPSGDDWRDADTYRWGKARWLKGVKEFLQDKRVFGKTIVVGHYPCNWYRDLNKPEKEQFKDFSIEHIIKDNGDAIYSIDACTAYSKKMNVLVIED